MNAAGILIENLIHFLCTSSVVLNVYAPQSDHEKTCASCRRILWIQMQGDLWALDARARAIPFRSATTEGLSIIIGEYDFIFPPRRSTWSLRQTVEQKMLECLRKWRKCNTNISSEFRILIMNLIKKSIACSTLFVCMCDSRRCRYCSI